MACSYVHFEVNISEEKQIFWDFVFHLGERYINKLKSSDDNTFDY